MAVSAVKIVEEPDVEITTDAKVVGTAPKPAAAAAPAAEAAPAQAPPPAEPAPGPEGSSNALIWGGLILVAIVVAVFLFRKSSAK